MVQLPTIPYGGLFGIGGLMIIGSFFTKGGTKSFLLKGGIATSVYHFIAKSDLVKSFSTYPQNVIPYQYTGFKSSSSSSSSNYGTYNTMPYGDF